MYEWVYMLSFARASPLFKAYRNSEAILGRALQGRRRDVIIATKVSGDNKGAAELEQAVEASLRELQTDYIDLFQVSLCSFYARPEF